MLKIISKLVVLLFERARYLLCARRGETFSTFLARSVRKRVLFRRAFTAAAAAHIFSAGESSDVVAIAKEVRSDVRVPYRISRRVFEAAICEGDVEMASVWLQKIAESLSSSDRKLDSAKRIYSWRVESGSGDVAPEDFEFFRPIRLWP